MTIHVNIRLDIDTLDSVMAAIYQQAAQCLLNGVREQDAKQKAQWEAWERTLAAATANMAAARERAVELASYHQR